MNPTLSIPSWILVSTPDGIEKRRVDAVGCPYVPGLVAHRRFAAPGWTITHELSGRSVKHTLSLGDAISEIRRLGKVADWTLDAESLRSEEARITTLVRGRAKEERCFDSQTE